MRCLGTIPVSEDIQVIVVDDNSPDADTYLEKYPMFSRPYLEFVRTTEGKGAGYARNVGLTHARGRWLLFADADDFFADGMQDIIFSHADSPADIIYFRKKNVYSSDVNLKFTDQLYLDSIIEQFKQGDDWPLRTTFYVPYAKMIKRALVEKWNIRYEEIRYGNDCFFAVCTGCHAETIETSDEVLYVKTQRDGSLSDSFCKKTGELEMRAEGAMRLDKFLMQHNMSREKKIKFYLYKMLSHDRPLFVKYYSHRLGEVYPSRWAAIKDLLTGKSPRYKVRFILFITLVECSLAVKRLKPLRREELEVWS
ncbi:MAG: glycosyltransferase [Muribaculaceae bacterium]|nr:glycosyltransferase [Muribaculaceae bacterium]